MDADLTCQECNGEGDWYCMGCARSGRRRPRLDEWDALVERCERAERNLQSERQHGELVQGLHARACDERNAAIAERDWLLVRLKGVDATARVRAALDAEPVSPADHGWESPQRLAEAMQRVGRVIGLSPKEVDAMEREARPVGADPDDES